MSSPKAREEVLYVSLFLSEKLESYIKFISLLRLVLKFPRFYERKCVGASLKACRPNSVFKVIIRRNFSYLCP